MPYRNPYTPTPSELSGRAGQNKANIENLQKRVDLLEKGFVEINAFLADLACKGEEPKTVEETHICPNCKSLAGIDCVYCGWSPSDELEAKL
jgi:hypothetical protein